MTGLIQKSGYIKPGTGGGHYAQYIATREGVELLDAPHPSHGGSGYLEYMAERPRSHGLFSADGPADLEKTVEEISDHTGPVWTFIWSLRREDAARLGYESGESWRKLLLAHQTELAYAMKISPKNFRWRAAFHDEKHHPHVHVMVWSADPRQGFLTEQGIEKMRSQLSNDTSPTLCGRTRRIRSTGGSGEPNRNPDKNPPPRSQSPAPSRPTRDSGANRVPDASARSTAICGRAATPPSSTASAWPGTSTPKRRRSVRKNWQN